MNTQLFWSHIEKLRKKDITNHVGSQEIKFTHTNRELNLIRPLRIDPCVFNLTQSLSVSSTMDEPSRRKKDKSTKKHKSGVRTKFLIESLRRDYYALRDENDRLREIVQTNLPKHAADAILADCFDLTSPAVDVASIDDLTDKITGMGAGDDDDD
jgi:hypothetical protein